MTKTELAAFAEVLQTKQAELARLRMGLDGIAIERSADALEEAQYKYARELAIASLNRDSAVRRAVERALIRMHDGTFGACMHCGNDISPRRLEAVPWTPFCIRCQEAADLGSERVLKSIEEPFFDAA
jgi:DnaK suppressor protein